MAEYILEVKGINKYYGGLHALKDVDFNIRYNEIVALVGDNGAGKSTLAKIISGDIIADGGEIYFDGKKVQINNPGDSAALGIQMDYQDLALVESLDVASNLYLGREIVKRVFGGILYILKLREMRRSTQKILKSLGIEIDSVKEKVRNLSGGQRQAIAVGRAAYWGSKLIIMDEPTAALGVKESAKVLDLIKGLKEKNISILIISHNIEHVFSVADRIAVIRQGRLVGEREIHATDGDEIVKMITGAEFAGLKI